MITLNTLAVLLSLACAFFCGRLAFRYNRDLFRAIAALERAYRNVGRKWSYWTDVPFRMTVLFRPEEIRSADDTEEVRAAKDRILAIRATLRPNLIKGWLFMLLWFIGTPFLLLSLAGFIHFIGLRLP